MCVAGRCHLTQGGRGRPLQTDHRVERAVFRIKWCQCRVRGQRRRGAERSTAWGIIPALIAEVKPEMLPGAGDGRRGQRCSFAIPNPPLISAPGDPARSRRPPPLPRFPAPQSSLTADAASRIQSLQLRASPPPALASPSAPHVAAGTSLQDHLAAAPGPSPPISAGGSAALGHAA